MAKFGSRQRVSSPFEGVVRILYGRERHKATRGGGKESWQ